MRNSLHFALTLSVFLAASVSFAQQSATPTNTADAPAAAAESTKTTTKDKINKIVKAAAPAATAAAPAAAEPAAGTAANATTAAKPTADSTKVAKPAAKAAKTPAMDAPTAPGGDKSLVWVNSKSKIYHCFGSKYYGKTKVGSYMAEDKAIAEGDRANGNKKCAM